MLETVRDIAIIFLALVNTVLLLMLVILAYVLLRLLRQLQGEMPSLFDTARRTLNTVEGTASFVGKTTVMPVIRASSTIAAASRFIQVMLGTHKTRKR